MPNGNPPKETTKPEKHCPFTFRVDDNGDFVYFACLELECQCYVPASGSVHGGTGSVPGRCGFVKP